MIELPPRITVGRFVHYTTITGQCRPYLVTRVWSTEKGLVNGTVFIDGTNDYADIPNWESPLTRENVVLSIWKTSVVYSENKEMGTWHWPEIV